MRKCVVALSSLLLLLFVGCDHQKEVSDQKPNENIKSIRVKSYKAVGTEGNVVKGSLEDHWNLTNSLYEFDENGELAVLSKYDNADALNEKLVYDHLGGRVNSITTYNGQDRVKSKEVYEYADGFIKATYLYHKCGMLVEKSIYENDGKELTVCRNYSVFDHHHCQLAADSFYVNSISLDSVISLQQKDLESRVEPYAVYKYKFADNRLAECDYGYESQKYQWNDGLVSKMDSPSHATEIKYDDHHNVIEIKDGYISGMSGCQSRKGDHYYYEYEYDGNGLWTKRIDFEGNSKNAVRILERTIEYRK